MSPIASAPCTPGGPTTVDTAIADRLRPHKNGLQMSRNLALIEMKILQQQE